MINSPFNVVNVRNFINVTLFIQSSNCIKYHLAISVYTAAIAFHL